MSDGNEKLNNITLIDRVIEKVGRGLSWGYLFIVFISFYEIVSRYIFHKPTDWVHETSIALAGFLMIYAGLFAYGRDKHIRVPILLNKLPLRWKRRLEIFSKIISLIFLLLLAYSAYLIAQTAVFSPTGELLLERSGSAWNPPIPGLLKASIFVFSVIFVIQILWKLTALFIAKKE